MLVGGSCRFTFRAAVQLQSGVQLSPALDTIGNDAFLLLELSYSRTSTFRIVFLPSACWQLPAS
eukprot:XP_001701411.1 predicted protein [Chlamydomonas reinhardtii]